LPPRAKLSEAVIAVEDEHFYSNFAVNALAGIGQAALARFDASPDPGGSTVEQQLAKRLYGRESGLAATLRAIALGANLSLAYSKAEILDMYLNVVY